MTHQRQFLPHCDRILVLKHGAQKALGTYSELASSALTELTQLQEDAEIDDAIYDQQLSPGSLTLPPQQSSSLPQSGATARLHSKQASKAHSQALLSSRGVIDDSQTQHAGSALSGAEAGPVQAIVNAEVPTAVAAAEDMHTATATVVPNSVETPDQALLAAEADKQSAAGVQIMPAAKHSNTLPTFTGAPQQSLHHASAGDTKKQMQLDAPTAFIPAVVKHKKFVLPPAVDNRWGPEKRCSRLWHKLRGSGNPQTAGDDVESDADEEPAQLNQQEGRATGVPPCC